MKSPPILRVGPLRTTSAANTLCRVESDVDDESLFFETDHLPLSPRPEAFGSALLVAALHQRASLHVADPVCPEWRDNVLRIPALLADWWQYPRLDPLLTPAPAAPAPPDPHAPIALCFSGGVDSFFTLLRYPERIRYLIFAHGYDLDLWAPRLLASWAPALQRIAAARDATAVVIRTNLRVHHAFRGVRWAHAHGGALAALGHLLDPHAQRCLISSSHPFAHDRPWGSHWNLDPLWSSRSLRVLHTGAEFWRSEKLLQIASDPLVRQHLRVCWKNHDQPLNCSRCEKCLRTQLVLTRAGQLEHFTVFDQSVPLRERIDRLFCIGNPSLTPVYEGLANSSLPADLRTAIRRLLKRSRFAEAPLVSACRAKWQKLHTWPERRRRRQLMQPTPLGAAPPLKPASVPPR